MLIDIFKLYKERTDQEVRFGGKKLAGKNWRENSNLILDIPFEMTNFK